VPGAGVKDLIPEPPSTYYYRQVYGCFFRDKPRPRIARRVGVDNVTFETDYPHTDTTWPHTLEVATAMVGHLPGNATHAPVQDPDGRPATPSVHAPHQPAPPDMAWPKPVQVVGGRTGVPVFVGGAAGPRLFEHIAGYATGWLPHGGAGVAAALPSLHAAFERVGRDPAELQIVPFGTVPTAEKVDYFARLGITEMVVQLPSAGRDGVWRRLDELSVLL
jgi:alkanesulfonate monooxygenase SsuD/methylene tetrahydromethanopterin reductase-like flavin-dependent oxidoreductase (luciferase family)